MDCKELILNTSITRNLVKWVLTFFHKKVMQTTAPIKLQGLTFNQSYPHSLEHLVISSKVLFRMKAIFLIVVLASAT